jgi:hypothetical protein
MPPRIKWSAIALAVISGAALIWTVAREEKGKSTQGAATMPAPSQPAPRTTARTTATTPVPSKTAEPVPAQTFSWFSKRPLAVARRSKTHEWTAEDGRSPDFIYKTAHNDLEAQRMVEENDRIKRRQLVYRNDTAAVVIQRARLSGEPVKKLTLPGLDGQEIPVEITQTDLAPSGQTGSLTGRIAGKPGSLVTLAFKFGREAFTVSSPEDGLYLVAEPREPGELIVKSIDPNVYASGTCGNQ